MTVSFFKVIRPGINSTFQDEGRFGLQHFGVPPSGCMDHKSFLLANKLVGNLKNQGVIEFAYQGPLLKLIKGNAKIAITGNINFKIINSNKSVLEGECNRSYDLNEGDQVDILATKNSAYGYLSVEGGFKVESFCNSVSTLVKAQIGPNNGKRINIDDQIIINKVTKQKNNYKATVSFDDANTVRVLKGPQYNYFSDESKKTFFSQSYKITNLTDRMGMRLQGITLKNIINTNIRSEGITKGAIQVPADGQPIILLTDHPTIGGYPKIANVISADYDLLVQKIPGTNISFKCIDLEEAEQLYKKRYDNISKIIKDIKEIN
ncbi:biotin-dependent carboxyltransferase family protein [Pelagibacteraceae bacterium]|nr:biotin-dependent carboxyltransferase family protein [Pelagibacteraceae bacterium]